MKAAHPEQSPRIESHWPDPSQAWQPYRPSPHEPWDAARAIHLRRRAGFGASWARIHRDMADGYERAIERVLAGDTHGPDGRAAEEIDHIAAVLDDSAYRDRSIERSQTAWLYRMTYSAHPLAERMIFTWHDLYAVNASEVGDARLLVDQHRAQRRLWRGAMRELHRAMLADHALQTWLDNVASRREHPNENLAREFLELFALGEGNYSERDVREVARALTGWRNIPGNWPEIKFLPEYFDDGEKTIFGQTGPWGLDDVAHIVTAQPAAALHTARLLWRTLVADTEMPGDGFLAPLAESMRTEDGDLDPAKGIETVLRSRVFHSSACRGKRVKNPLDFVVGALRNCSMNSPPLDLAEVNRAVSDMGLRLFHAPGVAGWPQGLDWLAPVALVARANFAARLGRDALAESPPVDYGRRLVEELSAQGFGDPAAQARALAELLLGASVSEEEITSIVEETSRATSPALESARRLLSLPQAQLC